MRELEYPTLNELPYVCPRFYFDFFTEPYLNMEDFFDIFYWILSKVGSIIIVAEDPQKVLVTTEILRSITFPFVNKDTYFVSLPEKMYSACSNIFPTLGGVPIKNYHDFEIIINNCTEMSLIVNLDKKELIVKHNEENFLLSNLKKDPQLASSIFDESDSKSSFISNISDT